MSGILSPCAADGDECIPPMHVHSHYLLNWPFSLLPLAGCCHADAEGPGRRALPGRGHDGVAAVPCGPPVGVPVDVYQCDERQL
jgi:hypothetical protein